MKFKILALACLSACLLNANEIIKVGATPVPHAQILNNIKDDLKDKGYTLQIKEFNDYILPNLAVDSEELDVNFFQHEPYLNEFNKNKGTKLIKIANIHIEPMGIYSKKFKDISKIKEGATIAIPNDPTNESRALDMLEKLNLVKFKQSNLKTPLDITSNPKKIKFIELKAAQLPRALDEVDFAIINSNYALSANLNPVKDAVYLEDKNSPYANILVVKKGNENNPKIQALIKALQSQSTKDFINNKYQGAIIVAF